MLDVNRCSGSENGDSVAKASDVASGQEHRQEASLCPKEQTCHAEKSSVAWER